jgi:hypothetical protein
MKNVLLISYHFPPSTEVGGIRIANFAKHLPGFGWNPVVLTIKDKHIENIDAGRLADFENTRIVRVGKIFKLSKLYFAMKGILHMEGKGGNNPSRDSSPGTVKGDSYGSETLYRKIRRYIQAVMALPDFERNWILPAAWAAIREVRKRKIDCILTSCPPYSSHLAGLLVKSVTGVRWIADYRDPWTISDGRSVFSTCTVTRVIEKMMEKQVIRHADTVLANTEIMAEVFKKRFVSIGTGNYVYLPNMIDLKMYDGFRRMEKYPKFTISYAGSLYVGRSPEPLFAAIRELQEEGKIEKGEILVKFAGDCATIAGIPIPAVIARYGLESSVEVNGLVPHAKALEIIRRSHLGLLLAPEQPMQIPAKVYEYMGLGTRILAIAREGATKDLMVGTGCGKAFVPSDIGGIKQYLLDSMRQREDDVSEGNRAAIGKFDVSAVVRTLTAELDKLCDRIV